MTKDEDRADGSAEDLDNADAPTEAAAEPGSPGPADGAATRSDESAGAPAAASAPVTTAPAAAEPTGKTVRGSRE